MSTRINRQWLLTSRPQGLVSRSNFTWREQPLDAPPPGNFLVRNIYLSLDPANRGWMNEAESYVPAVGLGEVMRGGTIGIVEESNHPGYAPGDLVQGLLGWQSYALSDGNGIMKLHRQAGMPITAYFGIFGHIGMTAYFGLLDIGKPQEGETLVVSAAGGAVGSLVGQIGKIKGCHVVGIAGSDDKCRWLVDELGFDSAINYKTSPIRQALQQHCPKGIDIYFENVGGEILDAVLSLINIRARIPVCGLISQYNAQERVPGPYNFANILVKRARVEGFIVFDYTPRYPEAIAELGKWYAAGKLKYRVDTVEGLENAPDAINRLFEGANTGKLLVKISDEPE